MTTNLTVKGMHCGSCKIIVSEALAELGAKNIKISIDEKKQIGKVLFDFKDEKKAIAAIKKEGYKIA